MALTWIIFVFWYVVKSCAIFFVHAWSVRWSRAIYPIQTEKTVIVSMPGYVKNLPKETKFFKFSRETNTEKLGKKRKKKKKKKRLHFVIVSC